MTKEEFMSEEQFFVFSDERLETMLSLTGDVYFEWNPKTKKVKYSKNFLEKFGYVPSDCDFPETAIIRSNINLNDAPAFLSLFYSIANGECRQAAVDVRVRKYDNSFVWCRVSICGRYDDNGELVIVSGIMRDTQAEIKNLANSTSPAQRDLITQQLNALAFQQEIDRILSQDGNSQSVMFLIGITCNSADNAPGEQCYNAMLKCIGIKISGIFRDADIIGRIRDDEFAVFLPLVSTDTFVESRAKTLCAQLQKLFNKNDGKIDFRMGIAASEVNDNFEFMYKKASAALLYAKADGLKWWVYNKN